jgi:hypothetical protein
MQVNQTTSNLMGRLEFVKAFMHDDDHNPAVFRNVHAAAPDQEAL